MSIDITKLTLEEILELKAQLDQIKFNRSSRADYYASWDWTKSNKELMEEYGVSNPTVSSWRHKLGHSSVSKYSHAAKTWDWSRSDTEIAREHKLNISTVKFWRFKMGMPKGPRDYVAPPPIVSKKAVDNRINWDWTKPDIELSREHNLTRERIRQLRAKFGKPKIKAHNIKYAKFLEGVKGLTTVNSKDAKRLGLDAFTFAKYCTMAGITRERIFWKGPVPKLPWHLMNWDLPSNLLSDIWKINSVTVYIQRWRKMLPEQKFKCFKGKYPSKYGVLVQEERRKAEEYFKQQAAASSATVVGAETNVADDKKVS